jgi:hypothetical protein
MRSHVTPFIRFRSVRMCWNLDLISYIRVDGGSGTSPWNPLGQTTRGFTPAAASHRGGRISSLYTHVLLCREEPIITPLEVVEAQSSV